MKIHVKFGLKRDITYNSWLKAINICLTEDPVHGRANKELVEYIASLTGIDSGSILITAGRTSKTKYITLPDTESIHNFLKNIGYNDEDDEQR